MKIGVLASGSLTNASTWYRIGQYLPFFKSKGWSVNLYQKENLDDTLFENDLIIVQKVLMRRSLIKKVLRKAKRLFFDFDDAIWTRPGKDFNLFTRLRVQKRLQLWCQEAEKVIVPNHYLAEKVRALGGSPTLLPMAIDLAPYLKREDIPPVMGWSGAPHNLSYLETLLPALKKVAGKLSIYSGKCPNFNIPFEHTPFTPGGESPFLQKVGIGLLPLPDDIYARGKSPIKALQYMAAGIPFVYQGHGGIEELVDPSFAFQANSEQEWIAHLKLLLNEPTLRLKAGRAARVFVEKNFSLSFSQSKFASLCLTKN